MNEWENDFSKSLQLIEASERSKAGILLSAIPDQEKWNAFLASAKSNWNIWRKNLDKYPKCLLILYGGLSFYEYDDNTFWPQFSRAVGETELISSNQQNDINSEFLKSANASGLYIQQRDNGLSYVGSSIYHIGIPLSLWDSFIEICEWALWEKNWNKLDNNEWKNSIERQVGGRRRLRRFLVENREAASEFIQEMIEARQRLNENLNLTLGDITTIIKLRHEYIDLVPETAEFLRPQNPESLMLDRPQLFWDENADRISLLLPSVKKEKLPAEWIIGEHLHQEASTSPDEFALNSVAFNSFIDVKLKLRNDQKSKTRFLRGIMPCGLFDHERRAFVDPSRKSLPIRAYTLISPGKLQDISREGFEKDENSTNQEYELEDGTKCYITRLWPIDKNARVSFASQGETKNFVFHTNAKVETRLFVGPGGRSANFRIWKDRIIIERSPLPCVIIPIGFLNNTRDVLQSKFQVYIDNFKAVGRWDKGYEDGDSEFYFWKRSPEFSFSNFLGKRILSIRAQEFGLKFEYKIQIEKPKPKMERCWKKLPGTFLPWFLLCQPSSNPKKLGFKWEDLILANNAIEPKLKISYNLLRRYGDLGFLKQEGRRWMINESRASFSWFDSGKFLMQFCGNPSILWGLFRYMHTRIADTTLPIVEVVDDIGSIPHLKIIWDQELEPSIKKYLYRHEVNIVSDLRRKK